MWLTIGYHWSSDFLNKTYLTMGEKLSVKIDFKI